MKELVSVNPYTGKIIQTFKQHSDFEVERKINELQTDFETWRITPIEERSRTLNAIAKALEEKKYHLAEIMTIEMGKPIKQAVAEVEKCVWVCKHFAEFAPNFLKDKEIKSDATYSYVRVEPLGVLLCIMPWNYPLWQFFRVLAPNIMLGNTLLLKHASNVSACSLAIEELVNKIENTPVLVQSILLRSNRVEALLGNPKIKAATLTGSDSAGRSVAAAAGKNLKKTVLELGGSNACIIFNDADIDRHIDEIVFSRFQNNGQSCIASKRFLVQEGIYGKFKQLFIEKLTDYKLGNPLHEETKLGPMVSEALAIELENQLQKSIQLGAKLLIGGKRKEALFEATLLESNEIDLPIFNEETFGPLAALTSFKTIKQAIEISNSTQFGLGASVYTENMDTAKLLISSLAEGAVFVNGMVKSDPRLPFGGIKQSGFGRELSEYSLHEFANLKTVWLK